MSIKDHTQSTRQFIESKIITTAPINIINASTLSFISSSKLNITGYEARKKIVDLLGKKSEMRSRSFHEVSDLLMVTKMFGSKLSNSLNFSLPFFALLSLRHLF